MSISRVGSIIKGGVTCQIGDPLGQIQGQALNQDIVVAHSGAIEGLGIFRQDHILIVGGGGSHEAATVASQAFFAGRCRAIGALAIVAALSESGG